MSSVEHAILLLAGGGCRLGDLTAHRPKCLLEIGGVSFLERSLHSLAQCGISRAVLVVGYQQEKIRDVVDHQYAGMRIEYVVNNRYAETNTAYSLWLAREHLISRCLLLEGDIVFEPSVLQQVLNCSEGKSVWAAVPIFGENSEGVHLCCNAAGYVSGLQLVRQPEARNPEMMFKCAGIQVLTAELAQSLASKLDETIAKGEVRKYADLVLGGILNETSMVLCSLKGLRWAEVDDLQDYRRTQKLFT